MSLLPTTITIAVDASLTVRALLPGGSEKALVLFEQWRKDQYRIVAPDLWLAEVATAVRKVVYHRLISYEDGRVLLHELPAFGVERVSLDDALCVSAYEWAERLGQSKAYDGFYMALAQRLGADLWTADARLESRARQIGVTWVRIL